MRATRCPPIQLDERFPVIPVRGLVNEGTKRFLRHQAETRDRFLAGELDQGGGASSKSSISGPARCAAR